MSAIRFKKGLQETNNLKILRSDLTKSNTIIHFLWDKLPKEIFPTRSDIRKNPEFYKNKRIVVRNYGRKTARLASEDLLETKKKYAKENKQYTKSLLGKPKKIKVKLF